MALSTVELSSDGTSFLVPLLVWNVACLGLYGWDKLCAIRRWRRIPEAWLLAACAFGGAPGAWAGCELFRHKTRKRSFRLKLVAATLVNGLWLWLWWRGGAA